MTAQRGYSDRINHAFAFAAKHRPPPADKYSGFHGSVRLGNVAVILASYRANHTTIVASILAQLLEETPGAGGLRERLAKEIDSKFGPVVSAILNDVLEPPRVIVGRDRPWRASRLDYLGQLSRARPEAVDVAMAEGIHYAGCLVSDVQRLGVEYVQTIAAAGPEDAIWWFESLAHAMVVHERWSRPAMLHEFRGLVAIFSRSVSR